MGKLQAADSPFSLLPLFHHIFPLVQCMLSTACTVYLLHCVGPCKGCHKCLLLHRAPAAPPLALALVLPLLFLTLFASSCSAFNENLPSQNIFPFNPSLRAPHQLQSMQNFKEIFLTQIPPINNILLRGIPLTMASEFCFLKFFDI